MQHLDEGTIHAWLDSALSPDEAAQVESHVAVCGECAERVATARGMIAASSRILSALDAVPFAGSGTRHAASGKRQAWRKMWASNSMRVAAAIAFLAAGVTVVNRYRDDEPSRSMAMQEMADSSPVSAAAPAPAIAVAPEQVADAASSQQTVVRSGKRQAASGTRETEVKAANPEADAAANVASTERRQNVAQRLPKPARTREALVASGAAVPPPAAESGLAKKDRDTEAGRMKEEADARKEDVLATRNVEGLDLLESSLVTEKTRLVRRTTYEVRPGVVVTLEESLPAARMDSSGYFRTLADAASRAVTQSERMPRTMKATPSAPLARAEAVRVTNSVRWTEPGGAEFTLSGPVSVRELEELKQRVILSRAQSP